MDSNISIRLLLVRLMPKVAAAWLGVILVLGATAGAKPGDDPTGTPHQLEVIRALLADMQTQLNNLQAGIEQNNGRVEALTTLVHERTDTAFLESEEIFKSVNSVEVTTELCFDTSLVKSLDLGGHAALGVGWSDVLELKAIGQVDVGGDFQLGLGHVVCIQVPIYSAYRPELELLPGPGESLHSLISNSALGAQATLSVMDFVYDQVAPVAEGAPEVFETLQTALTSSNIKDKEKLLDVTTYEPMMPPMVTTMLEVAPAVALDVYLDACGSITKSPLMADVDSSYYDWICFMEPDAQMLALKALKDVVDAIFYPLWCITHPISCGLGEKPYSGNGLR